MCRNLVFARQDLQLCTELSHPMDNNWNEKAQLELAVASGTRAPYVRVLISFGAFINFDVFTSAKATKMETIF